MTSHTNSYMFAEATIPRTVRIRSIVCSIAFDHETSCMKQYNTRTWIVSSLSYFVVTTSLSYYSRDFRDNQLEQFVNSQISPPFAFSRVRFVGITSGWITFSHLQYERPSETSSQRTKCFFRDVSQRCCCFPGESSCSTNNERLWLLGSPLQHLSQLPSDQGLRALCRVSQQQQSC
jgi:hypothetical protein